MDDINFEELDKAVNSALQQTPSKTEPAAQEGPAAAAVSDLPVQSDALLAAPESKSSTPSAPPRRRGQFMDMVHPSSDMMKPMATRPNRQGAMIQPLNPSIVETSEPQAVQDELIQPAGEMGADEAHSDANDIVTESTMKSEWPDPLDVMERTEHEKLDDSPSVFDESKALIGNDIDDSDDYSEKDASAIDDDEAQGAATSPFISGVGPEKRPLGAFANAPTAIEAEEPSLTEAGELPTEEAEHEADSVVEPVSVSEELPAVPVPQELTPEVVSVESDEAPHLSEQAEGEPTTTDSNGMAASIPQQYRNSEAPSEDQDSHPVFDTKDYHQPLTPPAKQGHTGLMIVVVLVLLALLGAGAWYAVAVLKLI